MGPVLKAWRRILASSSSDSEDEAIAGKEVPHVDVEDDFYAKGDSLAENLAPHKAGILPVQVSPIAPARIVSGGKGKSSKITKVQIESHGPAVRLTGMCYHSLYGLISMFRCIWHLTLIFFHEIIVAGTRK
jgi:hypothetical protein